MDYDGDGSTLTGQSYLELSDDERDLLTFCKENFEHTIVLINSSAAMELGFVESEEYGVDACLWIGHPGEAGLNGVADLIAGKANPSGKLVDTYAYDLSTAPSFYNTDNNRYTNMADTEMYGYYQYEEGIYVGYRYYETADAEGYFDSADYKNAVYKNDDRDASEGGVRDEEGGYENTVQYPFGYGLSYGTFTQEIEVSDIALELHGTNSVDVKVTNEGDYAGKQTVEVYMEAPYNTDENCGIKGRGLEKASKVLVGFAKTGVNSSAFVFDSAAGDFSFTGNAEADYYTVWVYALDEEGQEGESYVAASSRLTGEGEISGNVDLSELPFGSYHANLIEFRSSGEASEPIVQEFTVSGKLSVPEFKYVQEGTSVTVTLCADTLSAYNDKEMFTDIDINIYDESGEAIQTETITEDDLTAVMMGPMTSYSCEKAITAEAGNYKISLTAKGDGDLAKALDESEQIELEVADGGTSEETTSGYTEPEGGPGGMMH